MHRIATSLLALPKRTSIAALMALMSALLTVGVLSMVPRSAVPIASGRNGPRADADTPAAGSSIEDAEHANGSGESHHAVAVQATDLTRHVETEYPALEGIYKHLHANPELSYEEVRTAEYLAKQLDGTAFEVTRHFAGNGVVAVLRNGPGPTVLVRTEMDALPVTEKTGLPYASKVQSSDSKGNVVGVMHACGHDVHMTCWVGTAHVLSALRDHWHGTLVFIAQPAEEVGGGADDMIAA